MDVSGYSDAEIVNGEHGFAYLPKVKDPALRKLQSRDAKWMRFVLPVSTRAGGRVEPMELRAVDETGRAYTAELVTINPLFARKRHRYSYGFSGFAGAGQDAGGFKEWAIIKLDHLAGEASSGAAATVKVWAESNSFPSEPVFVPSPNGGVEDEGVVLSQVLDTDRRETYILVLDGKTLQELGRAYLGMVMPVSFHGAWVAEEHS